jgi:hypothetical protein
MAHLADDEGVRLRHVVDVVGARNVVQHALVVLVGCRRKKRGGGSAASAADNMQAAQRRPFIVARGWAQHAEQLAAASSLVLELGTPQITASMPVADELPSTCNGGVTRQGCVCSSAGCPCFGVSMGGLVRGGTQLSLCLAPRPPAARRCSRSGCTPGARGWGRPHRCCTRDRAGERREDAWWGRSR